MTQAAFDIDLAARPVTFAILGCGGRGRGFSNWIAENPSYGRVVAVAEPLPHRRNQIGDLHQVPADMRFARWEDLLARPRLADAVINTLMDRLHAAAATKALDLSYHMFLEKPMATTLEDCQAIEAAQRRSGQVVSVCHSLRYHPVYCKIKELIDSGAVGQIMSIDQLEGVDPVHQAHSFVRGNWGNESRSTFMLLSKSCHDVDIIMHLVGGECRAVSSFGSLRHFTAANRPKGAPDRCIDGCAHEPQCPYSAMKIYFNDNQWYTGAVGLKGATPQQREHFIRTTNYGRCAYAMDNDVVDHQVVSFEFDSGATGTFTMTAFAHAGRQVRIHGTNGHLFSDVETSTIELEQFWGPTRSRQTIRVEGRAGGHGGGDWAAMHSFVKAVRAGDPKLVSTTVQESLRTHRVAFAAETARVEKRIVQIA